MPRRKQPRRRPRNQQLRPQQKQPHQLARQSQVELQQPPTAPQPPALTVQQRLELTAQLPPVPMVQQPPAPMVPPPERLTLRCREDVSWRVGRGTQPATSATLAGVQEFLSDTKFEPPAATSFAEILPVTSATST